MVRVVLHQAVTDLRAQRTWVAVWAGLLLSTALGSVPQVWTVVAVEEYAWVRPLTTAMAFLVGAQYLVAMAIVARWAHADHAVASTSFWVSRPLSRTTILASKLADIVLWLLLPSIVVHLALQLYAGLRLRDVPLAALEIAFRDSLYLLPVAAVASLTRDLTRVILSAIASLPAPFLYAVFTVRGAGFDDLDLAVSKTVVALAVGLLCALAVVVDQYLHRRTMRAFLMLLTGALAMVLVFYEWNTSVFPVTAAALDPAIAQSGVTVAVEPVPPTLNPTAYRFPRQRRLVAGRVQPTGLPVPYVARHVETRSRLVFANGRTARSEQPSVYEYLGESENLDWMTTVAHLIDADWRFSRAAGDFRDRVRANRGPGPLFLGKEEDVATWDAEGARFEGELDFAVERLSVAARLPLGPGASAMVNRARATVLWCGVKSSDVRVDVRLDRPRLLWLHRSAQRLPPWLAPPFGVALVHPSRRVAILGDDALGGWDHDPGFLLWPTYIRPSLVTFRFDLGDAEDGTTQADREDWLRHGQLVLIGSEPAGRFTKQVSLPMKKRGE